MTKPSVKESLAEVLSQYLGQNTGQLYGAYFKDKDDKLCLKVSRELLSELIGKENADTRLAEYDGQI